VKKIAEEYFLTTGTLKKLVKKALNGESLLRKKGSGPKITKFDIGNRCLKTIFEEYGGELSQLTLTELVNQKGVKVFHLFPLSKHLQLYLDFKAHYSSYFEWE
jgi:predicted transcriptional regulator with HTH domain